MKTKNTNYVKCIAAAAMALGTAASGMAVAQVGRDVGAFNAAYSSSWYILPSVNAIDPESRFGTDHRGEGVGIRFGKVVSPSWDIQFGPTYSRVRDGDARYRQNTLGVDALYLFSRNRFRPLVLVGGGAQYDKVSGNLRSADQTSGYVNAGIGFQYSFSPQWGMQADVRRSYAFLSGDDFGFDRANTDILTVGLTYAFDKPVARAAVSRSRRLRRPSSRLRSPLRLLLPCRWSRLLLPPRAWSGTRCRPRSSSASTAPGSCCRSRSSMRSRARWAAIRRSATSPSPATPTFSDPTGTTSRCRSGVRTRSRPTSPARVSRPGALPPRARASAIPWSSATTGIERN